MEQLIKAMTLFETLVCKASTPIIKLAPNWVTNEKKWEEAKRIVKKNYKGKKTYGRLLPTCIKNSEEKSKNPLLLNNLQ
jgi:spore coat polysaccharide biosynthesis predicted glycosyltransferase SpsG